MNAEKFINNLFEDKRSSVTDWAAVNKSRTPEVMIQLWEMVESLYDGDFDDYGPAFDFYTILESLDDNTIQTVMNHIKNLPQYEEDPELVLDYYPNFDSSSFPRCAYALD